MKGGHLFGSFPKLSPRHPLAGWRQLKCSKIISAKGSTDLCSNSLGQRLAYRFAADGYIDRHVATLLPRYRERRDLMLACMEEHFPEGVTWTQPQGGFFIWVSFPGGLTARQILLKAVERKVAFVDGAGFVNDNASILPVSPFRGFTG